MEDSTLNEFWSEHNTFSQCFSSAFLNETGDPCNILCGQHKHSPKHLFLNNAFLDTMI